MSGVSLRKPERWAWHPAQIEPKYRNILRDLILLLPMWSDITEDHNIAPLLPGGIGPATDYTNLTLTSWTAVYGDGRAVRGGPYGLGYLNKTDPIFGYAVATDLRDALYSSVEGVATFTVMVFARPNTVSADRGLAGWGSGRQWWLDTNGGVLRIGMQTSATVSYGASNFYTSGQSGEPCLLFLEQREGVGARTWGWGPNHDFQLLVTPIGYMGPNAAGLGLFAAGSNGVKEFGGSVSMYAVWRRALTETEMRVLAHDPFGLFRRSGLAPQVDPVTYSWGRG